MNRKKGYKCKERRYTQVYDDKGNVIARFLELPYGYLYKDKFIKKERTLFLELEKDGYVGHERYNGYFTFRHNIYQTLQDLVDDNEDITTPCSELRLTYRKFGIAYDSHYKCFYYRQADQERYLYDTIDEALNELQNDMLGECPFADSERAEEDYFQTLNNEQIREYCSKNAKERIKIISSWWNEKTSKRKGVSL